MATPAKIPRASALTDASKDAITQAWNNGLTSYHDQQHKHEVGELSRQLGLPELRIKQYISNLNRLQKGPRERLMVPQKAASACNAFCSTELRKPGGSMAIAAQAWKSMTEDERTQWRECINHGFHDECEEMTKKREALVVKRKLKQLCTLVSDITDLGVDMLAVVLTSPRPQSFGSQKCQDFLDANPMFAMGLTSACLGSSGGDRGQTTAEMRGVVRAIFNDLYAKAIKKPQAKFPYKSMADNTVQIRLDGMGEGFQIKKPSHYCQSVMKTIIENKDSLQLTVRRRIDMNLTILIGKKFKKVGLSNYESKKCVRNDIITSENPSSEIYCVYIT
ncbi:hypothetical protein CAPTEDRAFT_191262 [Capitella teleta]|uniref:Uncharacterized protein n=1 Tax=Capitella teleta TaxID=283909 RepID=R7U6R7_CAPTE|nr:hypothetical protein CAPTEDRAFT_191262 [Capitella teleta]|eukprot:ELU01841.1 hypothetical protein CAPTEDRAFT_191262 [Capitella teleta]